MMLRPHSTAFHSSGILCAALLLAAGVHGVAVWIGVTPILEGNLWDPDAYMHLAWVRNLVQTGNWYEHLFTRMNAPYGAPLHFSRLFDLVLLLGAAAGTPFVGFEAALYGWGVAIGPIFHGLSLILLSWGTRPFFSNRSFLVAAFLFSVQRPIIDYMMVGRPDHHSLLLLLMVGLVSCMLRALSGGNGRLLMTSSGVISGLALWVLVEGLLLVVLPVTAWGLAWIMRGNRFVREMWTYCSALAATTLVAVALEVSPSHWMTPIYDTVSVVHVSLALIMVLVSTILVAAERRGLAGTLFRRAVFAAGKE